MRKLFYNAFVPIAVGLFFVVFSGCEGTKKGSVGDLIVMEQCDSIEGPTDVDSHVVYRMEIKVDVPIEGPQPLVDSVMQLINEYTYSFLDCCVNMEEGHQSYDLSETFTNDGRNFMASYMDKYAQLIKDSLWNDYEGLFLKMETQTEKYVTYSAERYYLGYSSGSKKLYYTFDKQNGTQIQLITDPTFFKTLLPDYIEDPDDYLFSNEDFGLGTDSLTVVINPFNHFNEIKVPYSQIGHILSPKAREMVGL